MVCTVFKIRFYFYCSLSSATQSSEETFMQWAVTDRVH